MYDDDFYFYDERNAIGPSPWAPQRPGLQPTWFNRRRSPSSSRDHRGPRTSPAPSPAPQPPAPMPPAYPPGYPPMYPPGYGDPYGYGGPVGYDGMPLMFDPYAPYAFDAYAWPEYIVW